MLFWSVTLFVGKVLGVPRLNRAFKDIPLLDSLRPLMARRVATYHILARLFDLRNSDCLLGILDVLSAAGRLRKTTPHLRRHNWVLLYQHCNQPLLNVYDVSVFNVFVI